MNTATFYEEFHACKIYIHEISFIYFEYFSFIFIGARAQYKDENEIK